MQKERNRQWRIDKKTFWIKKRLISYHRSLWAHCHTTDMNYITRNVNMWSYEIGGSTYYQFKSNSWVNWANTRYGKKHLKCKTYGHGGSYNQRSSRITTNKATKEILKDEGII